jgi:hypothetical protein
MSCRILSNKKTGNFEIAKHYADTKYFGIDFNETLEFANKVFNAELVAIFEVKIPLKILSIIGDFTHVDPYLFKKGTIEIHSENLDVFNTSIFELAHKY